MIKKYVSGLILMSSFVFLIDAVAAPQTSASQAPKSEYKPLPYYTPLATRALGGAAVAVGGLAGARIFKLKRIALQAEIRKVDTRLQELSTKATEDLSGEENQELFELQSKIKNLKKKKKVNDALLLLSLVGGVGSAVYGSYNGGAGLSIARGTAGHDSNQWANRKKQNYLSQITSLKPFKQKANGGPSDFSADMLWKV